MFGTVTSCRLGQHSPTRLFLALGMTLVACSSGGGGGGTVAPGPPPPPSGGWALTGSLNTARDSHTATVLTIGPNAGMVLAAGGSTANGATLIVFNSTELFNPAAGTWSVANPMTVPRRNHRATLLPNGTILVTGGLTNSTDATNTTEIYDPTTGIWTPKAAMTAARTFHTATLLPNGKVLVSGGAGGIAPSNSASLATAEVYDPVANSWTPTGLMNLARQKHTATLLPTGTVLVAGSNNFGSEQAEFFDPATNTWILTGNFINPTIFGAAILLPTAKALTAGGAQPSNTSSIFNAAILYDPVAASWTATGSMNTARSGPNLVFLPTGNALIAGGATVGNTLTALAEAYSPASGTWTGAGSVGTPRSAHTTTALPNGQILVAGGVGTDGQRLASSVLYTPVLPGVWTPTAGLMNVARTSQTASLLTSGKVLVAGGTGVGGVLSDSELYDPTANLWTVSGSMTVARTSHTAVVLQAGQDVGKVLVAGGTGSGGTLVSTELYDPTSGQWVPPSGDLLQSRRNHTATAFANGQVLVTGGSSGVFTRSSSELFDPATRTWSNTGSLVDGRQLHTATILPNGKVLVAGGVKAGAAAPLNSSELYDPLTGVWTSTAGTLNVARHSHTAVLLPNGKVLVAGGFDGSAPTSSAELYDPASNSWTFTGSMATARNSHSATVLQNGTVLAAGGITTGSVVTGTAEVYNPVTEVWFGSNPLGAARSNHTAVLLLQGRTLVAGGSNASGPLSFSELYSVSSP